MVLLSKVKMCVKTTSILWIFVLVHVTEFVRCLNDDDNADTTKFDILFRKIQELETKNAILEKGMQLEIDELNKKIEHLEKTCGVWEKTSKVEHFDDSRQNRSGRMTRQLPVETYTAFFSVVTPHEVDHIGVNQNIVFDQASTNVGKAYNPQQGLFTAPVDGLYVFFATVTGKHRDDNADYYAHFDVNGRTYAKFVTFPNEQSSQMIVVQLSLGDNVSIKNNLPDDSILGSEFTTFSGFLLYEGSTDITAIVG